MPAFFNIAYPAVSKTTPARPFVLSIRPTYIERILAGRKTIELRRRFPAVTKPGTVVLLYATSPTQAIVASAILVEVVVTSLNTLWREYGVEAAITRDEFNAYFEKSEQGCALRLTSIHGFQTPIHLTELAREFEFSPPQSYCYWKEPLSRLVTHGRVKVTT